MNHYDEYINLSEESQFAAFDMLSDLIYTISELESRGNVHLSHLNEIRNDLTMNFTPTDNIKSLKCRPSVYESLIDNIDLIDFLDASQRADIESHILQFTGKGCFAIPQIPPPHQITDDYINSWNEFFSEKNSTILFKRSKRKKQGISKPNTIKGSNTPKKISLNSVIKNSVDKPIDNKPTSIEYKSLDSKYTKLDYSGIKFDLIEDRLSILEWTSTCGLTLDGVLRLQKWAANKSNDKIDFFIQNDRRPWQWRPPIATKNKNKRSLDIPLTGSLSSDKMCITEVKELRKLRFGPNRLNFHYSTNSFCIVNHSIKPDIFTTVTEKRNNFINKMTLFYDTLESLHAVHRILSNIVTNTEDAQIKSAIEKSLSSLSVFEDQYNTVFKDNILIKFRFIDSKKMKFRKKILALVSMILATPPCDEHILSSIYGILGSYNQFIKKSKVNRNSNLIIDFPQKSLIRRSCKESLPIESDNLSDFFVSFPTRYELLSLDLPCEIFFQHGLFIGSSFFYNVDLLLEQLVIRSPILSFTV